MKQWTGPRGGTTTKIGSKLRKTIYFTEDEWKLVQHEALRLGLSCNTIVEECVYDCLERQKQKGKKHA